MSEARKLKAGFSVEVDALNEKDWADALDRFEEPNIYQTWAHGAVLSGERNCSRIVLRRDGRLVAAVQARIAKLPLVNAGVAHVRWGPLWNRSDSGQQEVFRQAVRAMRNEFVHRRGLVLRLVPAICNSDRVYEEILSDEGFSVSEGMSLPRTILMDLKPSAEDIHAAMKPHWQRELKVAAKKDLEIIQGTDGALFDEFITIYKDMVSRKKFVEPNDIFQFRKIQERLPETHKMTILLARSSGITCSGAIASAMGKRAVYLFGATSTAGMSSRGSYLLQWRLIQELKRKGVEIYDLNGINPTTNPGTYKFKSDLAGANGHDVTFLGRHEASASTLSEWCVKGAEMMRKKRAEWRRSRQTETQSAEARARVERSA